jgi:hypothetical protein
MSPHVRSWSWRLLSPQQWIGDGTSCQERDQGMETSSQFSPVRLMDGHPKEKEWVPNTSTQTLGAL